MTRTASIAAGALVHILVGCGGLIEDVPPSPAEPARVVEAPSPPAAAADPPRKVPNDLTDPDAAALCAARAADRVVGGKVLYASEARYLDAERVTASLEESAGSHKLALHIAMPTRRTVDPVAGPTRTDETWSYLVIATGGRGFEVGETTPGHVAAGGDSRSCSADGHVGGGGGSAAGTDIIGSVTITRRTATEVEGVLTFKASSNGEPDALGFVAQIGPAPEREDMSVCCLK